MTFAMLDAADPADRARWIALWGASQERDVFAHPTYGGLFTEAGDSLWCASWSSDTGGILFPLIVRPLRKLAWAGDTKFCDATTPYGYGGPVRWGDVNPDEFYASLLNWFRQHAVVAAFARLSLFESLACPPGEPWILRNVAPNVVRTLDLESDALWKDYAHKVRKNVKRARSHDLRCERDETGAHLDLFLEIYESTLSRRDAAETYYFDTKFFESITGLAGSFVFFHVWQGDQMVSTELVLRSRSHLYSYLGGTRAEAFKHRPNDLLKHEIISWGSEAGLDAFVLGGGYTPGDGIFKYKRAFAPKGVVEFRTASVVTMPGDVERLVAKRREWESEPWEPRQNFFPPYRA